MLDMNKVVNVKDSIGDRESSVISQQVLQVMQLIETMVKLFVQ